MRYGCVLLIAGLLPLGVVAGCRENPGPQSPSAVQEAPEKVLLCTHCGQIKGSESCCVQGQELCSKCGLAKGSPGCCKLPKAPEGDVELCTKCGFIKDSPDCCKIEGKQTCSKCGLVKGSPGCCKIK